jgi:hypothetical protein
MQHSPLSTRISMETRTEINDPADCYQLAGMFNRYRPDGAGLERILSAEGIEGLVRSRIQRVYDTTAKHWSPGDLYFLVKSPEAIEPAQAVDIVRRHLRGLETLAAHVGNEEVAGFLSGLTFTTQRPARAKTSDDVRIAVHECLTDFLAPLDAEHHAVFMLHEALYSMANDYELAAYMLWPATQLKGEAAGALDAYIDVWRFGIEIEFLEDKVIYVKVPAARSS